MQAGATEKITALPVAPEAIASNENTIAAPARGERAGELSPRGAVQAALVALVRAPGRPRPSPPPEEKPAVDSPPAKPPAAHVAETPGKAPEMAGASEIDIELAAAPPGPAPKPAVPSRAASDIARQRELAAPSQMQPIASSDAPAAFSDGASFDTMIAVRKADGALGNGGAIRADADSPAPTSPGAWVPNLPPALLASTKAAAMPASFTFDQAAWSAALAQQVAAAATSAVRETSVRLEPEGLGPIEVRVRIESDKVDVRFAIEHPVTVGMVRAALPDLERLLAASGMTLGDASVAQQNASGREHAASHASAPTTRASEDEPAIAATETPLPRARVGLLDDFV